VPWKRDRQCVESTLLTNHSFCGQAFYRIFYFSFRETCFEFWFSVHFSSYFCCCSCGGGTPCSSVFLQKGIVFERMRNTSSFISLEQCALFTVFIVKKLSYPTAITKWHSKFRSYWSTSETALGSSLKNHQNFWRLQVKHYRCHLLGNGLHLHSPRHTHLVSQRGFGVEYVIP